MPALPTVNATPKEKLKVVKLQLEPVDSQEVLSSPTFVLPSDSEASTHKNNLQDEMLTSVQKTRQKINQLFEKIQQVVPDKKQDPITFVNQLRAPPNKSKAIDPRSNPVLANKINTSKHYDFD